MEYIFAVYIPIPRRISQKIVRAEKAFALDYNLKTEPHLTLHMARFHKRNFAKVFKALQREKFQKFSLELTSLRMIKNNLRDNQFIFIGLKDRKQIYALHKKVIAIAEKYRDGLIRTKDIKRLKDGLYTKQEKAYLQKYGYARVLKNFDPHISIGHVENERANALFSGLSKILYPTAKEKFAVNSIIVGLYERDVRGVYKKIVWEKMLALC